jgi:hypothetical protein
MAGFLAIVGAAGEAKVPSIPFAGSIDCSIRTPELGKGTSTVSKTAPLGRCLRRAASWPDGFGKEAWTASMDAEGGCRGCSVVEDTIIRPFVAGVVTNGPIVSGLMVVVVIELRGNTGPEGKGCSGGKCPLASGLISLG